MTSRILVDVRGEGAQLADQLTLLGFRVLPFYPVRGCIPKREHDSAAHPSAEQTDTPLRVEFPSDSPLFESEHHSLKAASDLPECVEVARLWKLWKRCPQCFQTDKKHTHSSCESPFVPFNAGNEPSR